MNLKIRGIIYSKFVNEAECARALKWPRQKLNKITTGRKIPDLNEVIQLSQVLETPVEEIANIFLNSKSPNRRQIKNKNNSSVPDRK